MRIVIIGARGQLGTDLGATLEGEVIALGHEELDITAADDVGRALDVAEPECVVNCAAYNFVDRAENEPDVAWAVNALGPRNLARYCGGRDIPLVHVSTDYVFGSDAQRSIPYAETDLPGPVSAYGTSKLAGEYFVESLCPRHWVVRTCGLYGRGGVGGKGNFVETMLRLGGERDEVAVVADQRCTPTATADLARALAALLRTESYGLYHATNGGDMSWYEFACEIFQQSGVEVRVRPISAAEFGAKARRPAYSVLDNTKLFQTIGFELPPWQDALERYLAARSEE